MSDIVERLNGNGDPWTFVEVIDEITRLRSDLEKAIEALMDIRTTAAMLLQNAYGCAANHYQYDFSEQGVPGWILDCEHSVNRAATVLKEIE